MRQQAFDDDWNEIPPNPRFRVQRNAYQEVKQWQSKEIHKLSRSIPAILASALQNPDSSPHHIFQNALKCFHALVDFSLMAQYCSHTPDTLSYMERYLMRFHCTKDVF